eukprot:1750577-Rhodomonas_salina.2
MAEVSCCDMRVRHWLSIRCAICGTDTGCQAGGTGHLLAGIGEEEADTTAEDREVFFTSEEE